MSNSKYPHHVRYQLRLMFFAIQAQFPGERENLPDTIKQVQNDYIQLLRDPGLSVLDRRMSYNEARKTLGAIIRQDEMEFLKQLESLDGIDPWLKEMLSGLIHHKLAWRARGSGYANTVTERQWEVFRAKLAQAQSHWLKAWKLKPDYPEAATELLRAAMANRGVAGEGERFWLERAVEAQFDYEPAYEAYLWAIRPRWGGSHEMMLAFGRECQATKRFDTTVPWQFHRAVQDVASELGEDGSDIYRRLGIADDYLSIIQGYREQTRDPDGPNFYDSQKACVLMLAGRNAEAKKTVDRLGKKIDERGFETFEVDLTTMLEQLNP